jgi:hypothetical protein
MIMSNVTDIRQSPNQIEEFMKILLEKIDSNDKTIRFVLVGKFYSCVEFAVEIYTSVNPTMKDYQHTILCSIDPSTFKHQFRAGRFRLDNFEVYVSDPMTL